MRGQIQFSFNWILVAVAGTFFLLLFIAIARNLTDTGEERQETQSFQQVMRTIENAKGSLGSIVRTSFSNLQTTCENSYAVQLSGQIRNIPEHMLFSPPLLDGLTTIRSEELYIGMPITAITYMMPNNKPLYVQNTVDVNVREFIGGETVNDISDSPQDAIFVTDQEPDPSQIGGRIVIKIPDNAEQGRIIYSDDESTYVNKELLLAAIVSTTKERYECGLGVAEQKMHFLANFNKERINQLLGTQNENCERAYNDARNALTELETTSLTQINEINSITQRLNRANSILLANSCPTI